MTSMSAGRSRPLHDRYQPECFAVNAPPHLQSLDLVGGMYSNAQAQARVLDLSARERGRRQLVFNGDFHGFDADPAVFAQVQQAVQQQQHQATRGSVETELAADVAGDAAGCGCVPAWGRCGVALGGCVVAEGIAIDIEAPVWRVCFLAQSPAGSDAHASYLNRIARGPAYGTADVVRYLE